MKPSMKEIAMSKLPELTELCRRRAASGQFNLSCRDVGDVLGINPTEGHRLMKLLIATGVIERAKPARGSAAGKFVLGAKAVG